MKQKSRVEKNCRRWMRQDCDRKETVAEPMNENNKKVSGVSGGGQIRKLKASAAAIGA